MLRQFPVGPAPAVRAPGPGVTSRAAVPHGPVEPRPAATIMLVRDGSQAGTDAASGAGADGAGADGVGQGGAGADGGVEVFVFRRVAALAFAPGVHVFPGGRVDERDADPTVGWQGPPAESFAGPLSADPELARALVVAAVRETFEECGVLLAGEPGGDVVRIGESDWHERWAGLRERTVTGELSLAELLRDGGLVLRADLLRPWAHWITPAGEGPRRYDTRFFAAAMPAGQQARDLGGEGEQARWLPAADGVREYRAGHTRMLPPTIVCLEELAAAASVAGLLATPRRIRPVTPWPVDLPGGRRGVEVDLDGLGGGWERS